MALRMSRILSVILFCIPAFNLLSVRADEIDDSVKAQMDRRHIPGLALAVVREGKMMRAHGYGWADLELNVAVTTETVFEIGSITKQFTAVAILMLVEEGKLGLDENIRRYLDGLPEAWNNITVRHLLTHTSGLKSYNNLRGFEASKHLNCEQFIKALSEFPLDFPPGESWSYCNSGYNLLGFIIEKASGQSYWQFLDRRIFRPLGMTNSQSRDLRTIIPNRASGYEMEKERWINRDSDLTDVFAAGAIVSTVLDLAKWEAALDSRRLLKRSSFDQMWTPVRLNSGKTYPYGFGWRLDDDRAHKNIGHSGSTSGFSSSLQRFPDDKLTVIVLCNSGEQGVASAVAREVAAMSIPGLRDRSDHQD
jgi:CubicO group peptidase (beta-lactamase class C family)